METLEDLKERLAQIKKSKKDGDTELTGSEPPSDPKKIQSGTDEQLLDLIRYRQELLHLIKKYMA